MWTQSRLVSCPFRRRGMTAVLVATLLPVVVGVMALSLDGGLLWLWGALALWMVARFVGMAGRFVTTRWQVEGATR